MKTPPLVPVQWIEPLKGCSAPQLLLFSDGHRYVVKFKGNRQGTRLLVNEYVIGRLAELLSLPVPPFVNIPIDEKFLKKYKSLSTLRFQPGTQIAFRYVEDAITFPSPPQLKRKRIVNHHHLPQILVFDHWISNSDRNRFNILLRLVAPKRYSLYMIDHGNCFPSGFKWKAKSLKAKPNLKKWLSFHQWCLQQLKSKEEIFSFVKAIEDLSPERIYETIHSIPQDWSVSKKEKEALFKYLVQGKGYLPRIMTELLNNDGPKLV